MPIKTYATKEEVPEAQRDSAVELKDGKWAAEEVAIGDGGAAAIKKERDARKAAEKERDEAKTRAEELELQTKAAEGKVSDVALANLRKEFDDKLKVEKERADKAEKTTRDAKKERLFDALAVKSGAMPDRLPKMKRDVLERFDLNEAGDALILNDGKGGISAETPDDFLGKTYKTEAPFFYAGANGSGSSAEQSEGGGGSGYDPVKAGKEAAAVQKKTAADNQLAYK